MEIKEFVGSTVKNLDTKYFEYLKEKLTGEYLTFYFVGEEKITKDEFCEKLVDYFEKVEIKINDKFTKLLTKYVSDMDEVVKKYIPKEPSAKKGEPIPPTPRSIKYYKHALEIKSSRNLTMKQIEDYSRIMIPVTKPSGICTAASVRSRCFWRNPQSRYTVWRSSRRRSRMRKKMPDETGSRMRSFLWGRRKKCCRLITEESCGSQGSRMRRLQMVIGPTLRWICAGLT